MIINVVIIIISLISSGQDCTLKIISNNIDNDSNNDIQKTINDTAVVMATLY